MNRPEPNRPSPRIKPSAVFPTSLFEFTARFATKEACWEYLRDVRWPNGFVCPRDDEPARTYISTRGLWRCPNRHDTSVTAGTVMPRTHTSLRHWFWAAYLMTTVTPGISALQLARQLNLRYETAFQILHKLRAGMVNPEREKLSGDVQVDETFVFGHRLGATGRALPEGKALVVAAIEDHGASAGRVRLRRIMNANAPALTAFVEDHVEKAGSTIITDGWAGYFKLDRDGWKHVIREGENSRAVAEQLVHVHRVFSNLKAWLIGTHHGVSPKHLQAYLNEYTFRFNRRFNPMAAFHRVLGIASGVGGPMYHGLYRAGTELGWTHKNPEEKP